MVRYGAIGKRSRQTKVVFPALEVWLSSDPLPTAVRPWGTVIWTV